ncbi:MAG: glycosyltransferase [Acidimicrobiales bacterium]
MALTETRAATEPVALVHDYLTQLGGAERVALSMARAFPEAALYTSFYDPAHTYPGFGKVDVRPMALNRSPLLRGHFRAALPVMAPAFSALRPPASVTLCSSSGWAHGVNPAGRKVVYCHAPARWLYQASRYLGGLAGGIPAPGGRHDATDRLAPRLASRSRELAARGALGALGSALRSWDRRAAASAHRYLANSTATAWAVRSAYGIEAEVLPPPPALHPGGAERAPGAIEPGFWLCVARLLPYKNVDVVMAAVARLGDELVVVGDGPDRARIRQLAGPGVHVLGAVGDEELRWCYRRCRGLVAASYEDYGLTPLEAASFGKPSAVLRWGGFLDTVVEDRTGVFFDDPEPEAVAQALRRLDHLALSPQTLVDHAAGFGEEQFRRRLREIVAEELALAG